MHTTGPALAPVTEPLSLLDHDDDLAAAVPAGQLDALRGRLRCRTFTVGPGVWRPPSAEPDVYGLYVVDGLLVRRLHVGNARAAEILGPTDVLRPWQEDRSELLGSVEARWTIPVPARLAVLDADITAAAGSIPALNVALSGRLLRRARELAYL